MKRYAVLAVIVLMMVLCGGCGGEEQYVIDRPSVYALDLPDNRSNIVDKMYKDELVEVISTPKDTVGKWYMIKGVDEAKFIPAEVCSADEARIKEARALKEKMDTYIGKECAVILESGYRGSMDNNLKEYPEMESKDVAWVFENELLKIKAWKKVNGEIWLLGEILSSYEVDDTRRGWIKKDECIFDENEVKRINQVIAKEKKELAELEKQQKEYAKNNPLTYESWTKTEDMLSYVYVEVTNNTDKEQQAIVEVKLYQDGVYLGKLMNLDTIEPHGIWRTKFLANTYVSGNYTYKVELKKDILD